MKLLSHVQLFTTQWSVAHQAPLSMGFSRQEYWSGLPFPFPGDLPDPGNKPRPPALWEDSLTSVTREGHDQNHPKEKEIQKDKELSKEVLQIAEKKRNERQRRKGKNIPI